MKIDPSSQSLILPGESPEADQRFERALRLNGTRDAFKFTLVTPPASAETVKAAAAVAQGLRDVDAGEIDAHTASRPAVRRDSHRWKELYRMVTQADRSAAKGEKLDVIA